MPEKFSDHPLSGDWDGYRDCHLKPDLILIYKADEDVLRLARAGGCRRKQAMRKGSDHEATPHPLAHRKANDLATERIINTAR